MAAKHHIDNLNGLIITDWMGDADVDKFINAYRKYQKNIRNSGELREYNEIVDFSGIQKLSFSIQDLKKYAGLAVSFDQSVKTKLALIVKSRLAHGLASGYVVLRKIDPRNNKSVKVFRNNFDALKWINSEHE